MEEEVLGKAYDHRLMRRLLGYLRPYRQTVLFSLALLLVDSAAQVAGPLLTKVAVDRYLSGKPQSAGWLEPWLANDAATGLLQISGLYLLALIVALLLGFTQSYLMQRTGQEAMFDLRRAIMARLQQLDIAYFDRHPVGRVVTRVTTDVDTLNELFSSGLVTILGDLLVLAFILTIILRMNLGLSLVLLATLPFVILATVIFRRTVAQSYRNIRIAIARINAYLQEHVNGIGVLQLFNRERKSQERFAAINQDHMDAYKESIVAYGWFYPVVEFLSMLGLAGMLAYGGVQVERGTLTLGVLVAFFQYGMRLFRPIQDLSEKYNILQGAMASAERIFVLLDTPAAVVSPARPKPLPAEPQPVTFDHVWFAYKDEDWVLRDVSFTIRPGETIAVVGHTGAGKTTMTNLLLRFYDVQRGAVRIGGVDLREFDLLEWRRRCSIVLQDPYLLTGSLAENIRLGTASITDAQIERAAEQVNLLDFVRTLPDGFRHQVRERGLGLSTGQKQLVSFARALAHDPQVLVLDEATSSVDTETELRIREALDRMVQGRTSIIIAHRLSTVQRADRIIVLHKGELREIGTHQELLAQRGLYWKLFQLQYQEEQLSGEPLQLPA